MRSIFVVGVNVLTASRILLMVLAAVSARDHDLFGAVLMLSLAAGTDWADGWTARTFNLESSFGKLSDPAADKLGLNGYFFVLMRIGMLPMWYVVVVFARDLGIIIVAAILRFFYDVREFPPIWAGKVSTFGQFVVGLVALPLIVWPSLLPYVWVIAGISTALTLWSSWRYAKVISPLVQSARKRSNVFVMNA